MEIKDKDFIDVVTVMSCQNSSWIIDSRIYGEGTTQVSLYSPDATDPLTQNPG